MNPLDKARELILSLSSPIDAAEKIKALENLSSEELQKHLDEYYNTAPTVAQDGNTKEISVILRVFEHFGDKSHDRMLLHYLAQAESNEALKNEKDFSGNSAKIHEALQIISAAFADADALNEEAGQK